jgi:hypothetical protein
MQKSSKQVEAVAAKDEIEPPSFQAGLLRFSDSLIASTSATSD